MTALQSTEGADRGRVVRRDAQLNRDRLVAAATQVFARLGPDAQLEDVAKHAGLGVGTAYRHLHSREEALAAVLEAVIADVTAVAVAAEAIVNPWEALTWFLTEVGHRAATDRGLLALLVGNGVPPETVEELRAVIGPRSAALLNRAKAAGAVREDFMTTDIALLLASISAVGRLTESGAPGTWRRTLAVALDGLRVQRDGLTSMDTPALSTEQLEQVTRDTQAEQSAARRRRP